MKKILRIALHEFGSTVTRRSFLIVGIDIPILATAVISLISLIQKRTASDLTAIEPAAADQSLEGFVDLSGLISAIPDDIPQEVLIQFDSIEKAAQALNSGQITRYYILPADILESRQLRLIDPEYSPIGSRHSDWAVRNTLLVNLLMGDQALADWIWNPMTLTATTLATDPTFDRFADEDCSRPGYTCRSNEFLRVMPMFIVIIFFVMLTQGSSLLIRSVSGEKENRTIEILLSSISPTQLLSGKVLGLGVAALMMPIAWMGSGYLILRVSGGNLSLPTEFSLPFSFVFWTVLLFALGYGIYASLLAGVGALLPDLKAATQISWLLLLPLIAAYIFSIMPFGAENPDGPIMIALSLFPLTAPVAMVVRILVGVAQTWELVASTVLMAITIVLIARAAANFFRAQYLLMGEPFRLGRFVRILVGAPL